MGRRSRASRRSRRHDHPRGDRSAPRTGTLTIDRRRRSGHYQGTHHSEVYRDGKVFVYTAWDDNAEEVGRAVDFGDWVRSFG